MGRGTVTDDPCEGCPQTTKMSASRRGNKKNIDQEHLKLLRDVAGSVGVSNKGVRHMLK